MEQNTYQVLIESEEDKTFLNPSTPSKQQKKKRQFDPTPSKVLENPKKPIKQLKSQKNQKISKNLEQILELLKKEGQDEKDLEAQKVLEETTKTIQNLCLYKNGQIKSLNQEKNQKEQKPKEGNLEERIQNLEDLIKGKLMPQIGRPHPKQSYAEIASKNLDTQEDLPQKVFNQKQEEKRKKSQIESPKRIFIKVQEGELQNLQGFQIRNEINRAFQREMQIQIPVLSLVSKTFKGDRLVLTLMSDFSNEFLLENQSIWQQELEGYFPSLKTNFQVEKGEKWHNLVIHGIPLAIFNCENGLDLLQEEIETYNPQFRNQVTRKPIWLSSSENRETKTSGSILLSLKQKIEPIRILIGGEWLKVSKYLPKPNKRGRTQCYYCQKFGHSLFKCLNPPKCRFCAKGHILQEHYCKICKVLGASCSHLLPKCSNCQEKHLSIDLECVFFKKNSLENKETLAKGQEIEKEKSKRKTLIPKISRKDQTTNLELSSSSNSFAALEEDLIGKHQKMEAVVIPIPKNKW